MNAMQKLQTPAQGLRTLKGRPSYGKGRHRRCTPINRVFENHVVIMRESDNGMSTWQPIRMMSSKAAKTDWLSALYQESIDLTQEDEHSLMNSGLPLFSKTIFLGYKRLRAYAMEVADAKLQTLLQSLSGLEGWLGCTWYQRTTKFLSSPMRCQYFGISFGRKE